MLIASHDSIITIASSVTGLRTCFVIYRMWWVSLCNSFLFCFTILPVAAEVLIGGA